MLALGQFAEARVVQRLERERFGNLVAALERSAVKSG